jgi:uncharacterized repeat protein (TIGR01451 family)
LLAIAGLLSLPAVADVTVAKTFLSAIGGNPVGLVNQGDVVVLAISTLNDGAAVSGGSLTDTLPTGMVIAANPQAQFSSGCGVPVASPVPGDASFTFSNAEMPAATNGVSGECIAYVNVQVIGPTTGTAGSVATLNNTIPASAYNGTQNGLPVTNSQPVTQSITVTKLQNLPVAKAFAPATVPMGEPTTVTITVTNPNASSAVGLSALTDDLPATLTAASTNAAWICSAGGNPTASTAISASGLSGTITFALPAGSVIAGGGTCTLSWPGITPNLAQTSGGVTTNSVPANTVVNSRSLQSGAATANLTVEAPLIVTKVFAPATVPATTTFSLSLKFHNVSAWTLSNIALTDNLPSAAPGGGQISVNGTPTTAGSCAGFSITAALGATSVQVSASSLAAGQTCTVTIPVTASNDGAYTNTTQPTSYTSANPLIGGPNTIPAVSAVVTAYTEITATKSARDPRDPANAAGSVAPDNPLAYLLTLDNYSTSAVTNVTVTDPLPVSGAAQVTFAAAPAPVFTGCTGTTASAAGAAAAQFTGITIAAAVGTSPSVCTITFYTSVPINWPVGTALVNTIPAGDVSSGGVDLLQGATPTAHSTTEARMTAAKANAPASIYQGQTSLVTITLTNNNYQDLTGVSINDTPLFAATAADQVVIANPANTSTTCGSTAQYVAVPGATSFQASSLTVTQRASCTVSFFVQGVVAGVYTNTIPANAISGTAFDGTTVIAAAAASSTLTVLSAINATKAFSPASVAQSGGNSRVTITLQNVSNAQLAGVALVDPLPTGIAVNATPQTSSSCAGPVTLTVAAGASSAALSGATIPANSSCLFQFNVTTNGQGGASIVNTIPAGGITANGGVTNSAAITGTLGTIAVPSVTVQKSFSPASLTMIGQQSLLTVTVSNAQTGAIALSNLTLTDSLPANIVVVPNAPTSTTCAGGVVTTPNNSAVTLSNASLAGGGTCAFTAYTTLKGQGSSTNTIPANAVHDDQDVSNSAGFSSNLSALPSLGVAKNFNPAAVAPNAVSTLTIQVLNSEPVAIGNVSVHDALPAGLGVATPTGATTTCTDGVLSVAGGVVHLTGGTVPAGGASPGECDVMVNVVASTVGTYQNVINPGDVSGMGSGGTSATNLVAASATLQVQNSAVISKAFASGNVDVGQVDRLTVTITNPNTIALSNAILADTLPTGVYLSATPNGATTCAASPGSTVAVSAIPGPGGKTVQLTGAQIPATGACTFSVDVLSNTVASFTNVIADSSLKTDEGVTNAVSASASFSTLSPPTLAKQFTPVEVAPGIVSKLRIVLGNPNPTAIMMTAALTDALPQSPGALTAALDTTTADALPRCANTTRAASTITVASGTSIPAGGCVILVSVTGITNGVYTNLIPGSGLVTNAGPNQIAASAQLLISSTLVSITGVIYEDNNDNGIFGSGDVPLAGQAVTLTNAGGTYSATTTTNSGGNYAFVGLPVDTYTVTEPNQPAGTLNGITTVGTIGANTVGTATSVAVTPSAISGIALTTGGSIATGYNFGKVLPSSISGLVFDDTNNDGIKESTEAGISGTTVTLVGVDDTAANVRLTTSTASDGTYSFQNLRPGQYTLIEGAQPAGTVNGITTAGPVYTAGGSTIAPNSSSGTATAPNVLVNPPTQTSRIGSAAPAGNGAGNITLPPNAYSPNNNFAEVPALASISGVIFVDNNADGVLDGPDTGEAGQPVTLTGTDVDGNAVNRSTTTAANGSYSFTAVAPGASYSVRYTPTAVAANLVPGKSIAGTTGGSGGATPTTALSISAIPITDSSTGLNSQANNFTLVPQKIDIVKAAGAPLQVGESLFQIPYIMTIGNQGTVPITHVQAADDLVADAPAGSTITIRAGSFSATLPGSAPQCAGPATAYNGTTNTNLLAGNFNFAPGDKCVIGFVMVVNFGANAVPAIVYNTAYASANSGTNTGPTFNAGGQKTGDAPGTLATDNSVNAPVTPAAAGQIPTIAPALPGTANGDAPGGVPTPESLSGVLVDVIKNAGLPTQVAPATPGHVRFQVPYTIVVGASQQAATNIQVVDLVAGAYTAGSPSVSVLPGSFLVPTTAPSAGVCAGPATAYDGVTAIALLAGNFTLPQGSQCTIQFAAVVDYASASSVPAAANSNLAFAVAGLSANPTGGTVAGSGNAASFTPAAGVGFIALDTSSGNSVVMAGNAQGATTFATTGGQSGVTGPTTAPTPTLGNQQLPATPNGDNSNSPTTQTTLVAQRVGLIKAVGVLREVSATTYQVPYTIVVKNTSGVPLSNLQVVDNLTRTFNGAGAAGIAIQISGLAVSAAFDAPAAANPTCTIAPSYDGVTQTALLGGSDTLLPGQKCVISFVATVSWGANAIPATPLLNQAFSAAGSSSQAPGGNNLPVVPNSPSIAPSYPASTLVSAASTNAVPAVTSAPGAPPPLAALPAINPSATPSPTPASITPAYIDVVKAVIGTPSVIDGSTFDVTYVLSVKDTGPAPDYNLQVSDSLRSTFATPTARLPTLTNGGTGAGAGALPIIVKSTAGHCTVATNFDGNIAPALLAGTDTLQPGEVCTLSFTVRVHYAQVSDVPNGTAQNNSAYASTTAAGNGVNTGYTFPGAPAGTPTPPSGAVATDTSTNGTALPTTPNGDVPSPTPVLLSSGPDLVIGKSHTAAFFTESNPGTYTIVVGNKGFLPTQGTYKVVDKLPAGMTVAAIPSGSGWNCAATVLGTTTATCVSSTVIAAGAGAVIDNPNAITLIVNVAPGACVHPNQAGQCVGTAALINTAVVSGGGELNIPFFTANDSAQDPTDLQEAGSISGQVWLDLSHNFQNSGDPGVAAIVVQILNANGNVVATTTTNAHGNYVIGGLTPGPGYQVRFKDPLTGAYYGRPVSRDPAGGNDPTAAPGTGVVANGIIQNITVPGRNGVLTNQSLPLDPGGIVYDSVARLPVAGALMQILGAGGQIVPPACLIGGVNQITTAVSGTVLDGAYNFMLQHPVPAGCGGAGTYQLKITPPKNYVPSKTLPPVAGTLSPPTGCINGAAGGVCVVENQIGPPVGAEPTPHYLALALNPATPGPSVVGNDIPLDPAALPLLSISKIGDRTEAELGATIRYTITVARTDTGTTPMNTLAVVDLLPEGFSYVAGTASLNGKALPNPVGAPGPRLVFTLTPPGGLGAGAQATLTYRVRLGVGSQQGSGINTAQATLNAALNCAKAPASCSNVAEFRVRITNGVFTTNACITGKVFVDCNNNHVQDADELGIPGVRIYLENGQYFITDNEGKYSYCGLAPLTHIAVIDPLTLPKGSRMMETSNRNMGDPNSLFLDLRAGSLDRADFIEGSCSNKVLEQVKARRAQGAVHANENERAGRKPLKYDAKPADYPAEGTDSANQPPVKTRENAPVDGIAPAPAPTAPATPVDPPGPPQ